jgi:protein-disulfide isomerase
MPFIWNPARSLAVIAAVAVAGTAVIGSAGYVALAQGKGPDDPITTRKQVEEVIREYLLAHPELLLEVMDKLQQQEDEARASQAKAAIAQNRQELNSDGYSYDAGNPKGDVTVIEFFDYNCGYCKRMRPDLVKLLEEDKNVRLVLKEFPVLTDRTPGSLVAARAGVAAVAQGDKYWAFHNKLLSNDGVVTEARVFEIAASVGLDVERLKRDMNDPSIQQRIDRNHKMAETLRIDGTPSFVIGDVMSPGAMNLDELKSLVAKAREKCETC